MSAATPRVFEARWKSMVRIGVVSVVVLLGGTALAADRFEDEIASIEEDVTRIGDEAKELDRQVGPGRGFITEAQAIQRYQDCVYLYLVGDYEPAAEGFFALVTTAALSDAGLHRDAEWYFAESLYQLGNTRTAESRYQIIADDDAHPFRQDAVLRLLEIYVDSGQTDRFYEYYEQEIVRGRVPASDRIRYSVAKSFFRQGDLLPAKSNLLDITEDSSYWRKAQYVLGAIMVKESDLDEAVRYFKRIVDQSVVTLEDRQLYDLALLAVGRVYMTQGRFEDAADYYGRISGDSEYLDEKLYEHVWTFIKQKEQVRAKRLDTDNELSDDERKVLRIRENELLQEALRGVEIFLLAFPEDEYTARLRLVQGALHIQSEDYDQALTTYGQLITDYTPIRQRFGELARSSEDPQTYFEKVVALERGSLSGDEGLPAYAMAMVMADGDLGRSLRVYRELQHQEENIRQSEAIIVELQNVLENATGIGGFEQLRYKVDLNRTLALQKHLELMSLEEDWLLDRNVARKTVQDLRRAREEIETRVLGAKGVPITDAVADEVRALHDRYKSARPGLDDNDRVMAARFDGNHVSLAYSLGLLNRAVGGLTSVESAEMVRIKERFDREVKEVAEQRRLLDTTLREAERVSVGLTRSGFGRLEDFFAKSVLRADVGIVDVYWAQKLEVSNELEEVRRDRKALRDDLEARFDLIQQKMHERGGTR